MIVFFLHYKLLDARKKYLLNKIKNVPIKFLWIEDEPNDINSYYEFNIKEYNRKLKYSEISLWYKHYVAYSNIIDLEDELFLVLEDDVIFDVSVFNQIESLTLPFDYDICYLGNGCGLYPSKEEGKTYQTDFGIKTYPTHLDNKMFYETDFGVKATDSYLITKEACKFLLKYKQINWPTDYHINKFNNNPLKIYWTEPPLFIQGSQNGTYERSI